MNALRIIDGAQLSATNERDEEWLTPARVNSAHGYD